MTFLVSLKLWQTVISGINLSNHSISGTVVGKDKLGTHLATFAEKTNGTFKVITNWVSDNKI